MASAFFRGPKSTPRWFARFRDAGGVWRARRVRVETRGEALRIARGLEGQAERRRYGLEPPEAAELVVGDLLRRWEASLTNRSAYDDRCRVRLHVMPRFGSMRLADLTLPVLMTWLDELRARGAVAPGTARHLLNIVSRFFGWAIERGLATVNPVRQIPTGKRPQHAPRREVPWIDDDDTVRALMRELSEPFDLMFYVGNRAGMRLGEICGLRLSDVAELGAGAFRVRYSYLGPLKEDRRGEGKVKWTPAAADAERVLGPWIAKRRSETSDPEAHLFPGPDGFVTRKEGVEYRWGRAARALKIEMTWYQATRHSFASRALSRGAPLDEVSSALGHSTPAVTARHYAHFVRKTFSPVLTSALSPSDPAPVLRPSEPAPARSPRKGVGMTNTTDREQGASHAS